MLNFFNKPYPAHHPSRKGIALSIGTGVFVGLFLFLFKPFGLHNLSSPLKKFYILGYGVITFIVTYSFLHLLPLLFPKLFDERSWTIGKEILFMNILILTIAACNTIYTPIISPDNPINLTSFLYMIINTFLVAIIPITFFVMYDHNQLSKMHIAQSESIKVKEREVAPQNINSIILKSQSESKEVFVDKLLYIESVGNYINVICRAETGKTTFLLRSTMKSLESQIHSEHIIRCHRSYFINLNMVIDVKGNAQGFKLSLCDTEDIVPVSRKYVPMIKAYFAKP